MISEEREERDVEETPAPAGPTQTMPTDPPEVADPNPSEQGGDDRNPEDSETDD